LFADAEKWLPPQNTNQELNERALNDEEYAEYVRQRDVRDQRDILQHRQRTGAPVVKHHREALERDQVETMRSLQGQFCLLHPFRKHLNGKRSSSGSKKVLCVLLINKL
jgi:hypothetical protein